MAHRTSRRAVLASLATAASIPTVGTASDHPRIEIAVVPTQRAVADAPTWTINEIARLLEVALGEAVPDARLSIGPTSITSVGDSIPDDARTAADWWRSSTDVESADCTLLLCSRSQTDWEHAGYARYDGEVAVATGADAYPDRNWMTIALHEVGHSLGLRHHLAGTVADEAGSGLSIMGRTYDRRRVHRFSESSQRALRNRY